MDQRLFPGDNAQVATDLNNLSSLLADKGDLAASEPIARQALEVRRRLFPGDHEDLAESLNNLAHLQSGRGDLQGAIALFREALAMSRRLYPGDHPRVAGGLNNLSVLLKNSGDLAGATSGVALAHYELHAWCLLVLGWVLVPLLARRRR